MLNENTLNTDPVAPACDKKVEPVSVYRRLEAFLDQYGKPSVKVTGPGNPYALAIGSSALIALIRKNEQEKRGRLKRSALEEIQEELVQDAEEAGHAYETWNRVAPIYGGVEIDLGDDAHTRIRIAHGKVEVITEGSTTLFRRYKHSRSMVMPAGAGQGDLKLLKRYLGNMDHISFMLLTAWLSYTLAHPKVSTSKYVILQVLGGQGSGKSMLTKLIKRLIDPAVTDAQVMATNGVDLGIAAQQSHVLCYDNLRDISKNMSDLLCTAATGGAFTGRQLYSNDEQHVIPLHVAMVLNGIHAFVSEPDLAQRCLPLYLKPICAENRKSELEMEEGLARDLPIIQQGLFDLIAQVQVQLPNVELTSAERMIDFCTWLGGMELAAGAPTGAYQSFYSEVLKQGQRDAIMDSVLGAAVLEFAEDLGDEPWSGTPTRLLGQLSFGVDQDIKRSREWPNSAVALSKRLAPLQAPLAAQGISVEFSRPKERIITIKKMEQSK